MKVYVVFVNFEYDGIFKTRSLAEAYASHFYSSNPSSFFIVETEVIGS